MELRADVRNERTSSPYTRNPGPNFDLLIRWTKFVAEKLYRILFSARIFHPQASFVSECFFFESEQPSF
jgi:hypothetical protein